MKRLTNLLLFILLLSACTATPTALSVTASPSPTPVVGSETPNPPPTAIPSLTPTILPTRTSAPSAIPRGTDLPTATELPTSTSTPYGPLSANGPHLAYLITTPQGGQALTLLNADASGRAVIPLPEGASFGKLEDSLSRNGEWLAFHTGSAGVEKDFPEFDFSGPLDLSLSLMHLPDGKITTVSKLLSKDYPANLDKVTTALLKNDPRYANETPDDAKARVTVNFMVGINAVGWSPDSRYLAFSGEMDGPSSDLYLYDTQSGKITRLTDGPEQMAGLISWSPDGKWIAHTATNEPFGEGSASNVFVVRPNGSGAKDDGRWMEFGGWVSPTTFRVYDAENGPGAFNLTSVNVETGKVTTLWTDSFTSYAFAPDDGSLAICGGGFTNQGQLPFGLYLFPPNSARLHIQVNEYGCQVQFRGSKLYHFIESDTASGVSGISANGKLTAIKPGASLINISPDLKWMILGTKNSVLITSPELYDSNDSFVRELSDSAFDLVFWRPDSQAIFYKVYNELYTLQIPDGKPILVDANLVSTDPLDINYRWVK